MKIAIYGAGRMGSVFAYHLARAGHSITLIARGARLDQLQRDKAVVTVDGQRIEAEASAALDATIPWDLVLVTVLASQVDAVLPVLQASAAKTIMFMFNTFDSLDRLRNTVGLARFAFGFPMFPANLVDGKVRVTTFSMGQMTTVTDPVWAKLFNDAGIPSNVHTDMESYLRSHVALVIPIMAMAWVVHKRGAGVSWPEARTYTHAMSQAFRVVRQLGNSVTPTAIAAISYVPNTLMTGLLWSVSRMAMTRELGEFGPGEARTLVDAVAAAAPGQTAAIQAIRP